MVMEEKGRLETLLNKGSQLETLCGVDVCVVCIDPVSGGAFTWPRDRSKVVGIIERYRSCSSSSVQASKKRKVSLDPQSSVSVASSDAAATIPMICCYQNDNVIGDDRVDQFPLLGLGSSRDRFDPSDMAIPEFWYPENNDGLGVEGFGSKTGIKIESHSEGFGSNTGIKIEPHSEGFGSSTGGFGVKIEPQSGGDMADELEALDSMIHRIEALENSLGKMKQEEIQVEEQQSQATQIDFDLDFDFDFDVDDNFWDELPQLDDPHFTPSWCDCKQLL